MKFLAKYFCSTAKWHFIIASPRLNYYSKKFTSNIRDGQFFHRTTNFSKRHSSIPVEQELGENLNSLHGTSPPMGAPPGQGGKPGGAAASEQLAAMNRRRTSEILQGKRIRTGSVQQYAFQRSGCVWRGIPAEPTPAARAFPRDIAQAARTAPATAPAAPAGPPPRRPHNPGNIACRRAPSPRRPSPG